MEIRRFYVKPESIVDGNIVIDGEEFLHLTKVLRHKTGYKIIVNNNTDGIDYYAIITAIERNFARAKIYDTVLNECKCSTDVILYQACPKSDKLDIIVQKACELGVNKTIIFTSAFSEIGDVKFDRLRRIAVEACKQCGRSRVPIIENTICFNSMLDAISDGVSVHFNEHERVNNYSNLDFTKIKGGKVNLIIGAEGGFSLEEAAAIGSVAKSVTLGKRILRCETAAITAMALTMYKLGELDC